MGRIARLEFLPPSHSAKLAPIMNTSCSRLSSIVLSWFQFNIRLVNSVRRLTSSDFPSTSILDTVLLYG